MAVYRIFPEKDSFIFTEEPTGNAGKDEIIEVGGYPSKAGIGQTNRLLLKFADSDIDEVVANKVGGTNFSSSLHLYLAEASEIPSEYTIEVYPIYTDGDGWDNGTGHFGDIPTNTTGVSWEYEKANETSPWTLTGFPNFVTASYTGSAPGGGNWYTASNGESMEFSQIHTLSSTNDININVTAAVKQIYSNTLVNNGFIAKIQDSLEFNEQNAIRLKYFGSDTNTIYPPFLQISWDDTTYDQGELPLLTTDLATIDITNNRGTYPDIGKQRFRIAARPQYPTRAFTTSSVYLNNYALPSASYWGLRDENTEEMIVDFNTDFTKISCDSQGPFFDVYMDGLQPERYYRILIKTNLDTSTVVRDDQNIFKVVRNG
tara:strand:+ start:263 stop:1381 length:1119 start_codon:yes stop_codon:yes gene_type:complete